MNPGGPGESGVDFVRRAAEFIFSDDLRDRFDIVGFDPRGVGASTPAVDCFENLDAFVSADPSPDSETERAAQDAETETLARACQQRSGTLLPFLTTEDAARDLDLLRSALGDDKITYFGFSYGTFLGAVYADLFPQNIRALALDGAVDPSLSPEDSAVSQIAGFERALDAFLNDCASRGCDFAGDADPGAAFDAIMQRIEQAPLSSGDGREVGPGLGWIGVLTALYNEESGWPLLDRALTGAQDGDGDLLLLLADTLVGREADGSYNNSLETRIAIRCIDSPEVPPEMRRELAAEINAVAPRIGPQSGFDAASVCDFWPVPPRWTPRELHAPGAPPILIVGTTGDPATPYHEAQALARQLESGVLLTYEATRHTAYGAGSDCIDAAVDAYLIDVVVPPSGQVCAE